MYYQVASKLLSAGATVFTQAVSMEGANAALVEYTSYGPVGGTVNIEESNDLENWGTGPSAGFNQAAYGTLKGSLIASRYVRLRFLSTGTMIVAAGINTSQQ